MAYQLFFVYLSYSSVLSHFVCKLISHFLLLNINLILIIMRDWITDKLDIKDESNPPIINKFLLTFVDKRIEKKFKRYYFKKSIYYLRFSLLTVILIYSAFGYVDYYSSPELLTTFFTIRFLIVVPILSLVLLLSYHADFEKIWQILLSISFFVGGTGIIVMLLKAPDNILYYGGMLLVFMAGYFFIKLQFYAALIPSVLLILLYNILTYIYHTVFDISYLYIFSTNTFYISANVIGLISLYNMENLRRIDFYQRHLLIEKQNEIALINLNLENKINERTMLLRERNTKLRDEMTERQEVESKLIVAKKEAEESNRLKTAFLNNMSHEIRTPLNSILGFIGLLQDTDLAVEDKQDYLEIINKSSQRLITTVNDIIDISKIETGQVEHTISSISVNLLLNNLFDLYKNEATSKGVKLVVLATLSNDRATILSDYYKLNVIISNLLNNAIKFTNEGIIEFGYHLKNEFLIFFIKDSGIGISKGKQRTVFNSFEQADLSSTRAFEGSGLGLSIAKAYIELLGGELWVKSEENVGSEFKFKIPYNTKKENKNDLIAIKENKVKKFKDLTVLIAEDEELNRKYFEVIFKDAFKIIYYAHTGQEAIDICLNNPDIDLILMDMKMPEVSGYTATKEIRAFDKKIIIISQTAYGLAGDKENSIEAGCDNHISKPIKKDEIFEMIGSFFNE